MVEWAKSRSVPFRMEDSLSICQYVIPDVDGYRVFGINWSTSRIRRWTTRSIAHKFFFFVKSVFRQNSWFLSAVCNYAGFGFGKVCLRWEQLGINFHQPSSVSCSSNKPSATRYASSSLWNSLSTDPPCQWKRPIQCFQTWLFQTMRSLSTACLHSLWQTVLVLQKAWKTWRGWIQFVPLRGSVRTCTDHRLHLQQSSENTKWQGRRRLSKQPKFWKASYPVWK